MINTKAVIKMKCCGAWETTYSYKAKDITPLITYSKRETEGPRSVTSTLDFFLCLFARHCATFIHTACIRPVMRHSLTDSYLFAQFYFCHIHSIQRYWVMGSAHDGYNRTLRLHTYTWWDNLKKSRGDQKVRTKEKRESSWQELYLHQCFVSMTRIEKWQE